jgi:Uncharacterized conserved protein
MLYVYPAIFHKEDASYWVEFPDLEGCQTYGGSLAETMELAMEALGVYLAVRMDENLEIPNASDIVKMNAATDTDFISYVSANPSKYRENSKAVKKTLTIPGWLNEEAEKRHVNFSAVLQEALVKQLGI